LERPALQTFAQLLPELPIRPSGIVPFSPFENYVIYERVPAVVDASALIGDSLRFVKHGREPLLLGLARQPSIVNLYSTCSVRGEVEEHLAEAARENHLPPRRVESFWREGLRPAVSFVNIEAFPPRDARVARLAHVDPDDAPTGSLAELLGACLVSSLARPGSRAPTGPTCSSEPGTSAPTKRGRASR
jgi:hypothetical protein